MDDVTKYKPIINKVLAKLKVPRDQREDLTQECYIALLEQMKPEDTDGHVAVICRRKVAAIWRAENHTGGFDHEPSKHLPKYYSLSDPRTAYKVSKIPALGVEVSDEKLYEAINLLPHSEFKVIYLLYVEGKTQEQAAVELQMTRSALRVQRDKGVKNLKKYFEVS